MISFFLDPYHCKDVAVDNGETIVEPTTACIDRCKKKGMDAACLDRKVWPRACDCF